MPHCNECSSDNVCENCDTGYYLNAAASGCSPCSVITNCANCSSNKGVPECTGCNLPYELSGEICCLKGYENDGNGNCVPICDITNCKTCTVESDGEN